MTFGKTLKQLRESNGYTMDKLIEIYNKRFNGKMNKSTLSRYENELQEPMYTVVLNLANIFNVSVDYISGNYMEREHSTKLPDNIIPLRTKKLPMLGNIACGEPVFANEEYGEYIDVDGNINADFCLRAKGDSMIGARIQDGDIVFIKKQDTIENGGIAAVLIEDEATLKRVQYDREEDILRLFAENPRYKTMSFSGEKLNQIKILGKAVAFQSDVK